VATTTDQLPVLHHLKVSNYNEKARWALDYKGVPHVRQAAMPGRHVALAKQLSGRRTLPVLMIDGQAIGDSSDIIAELERRHPDPPLYPADPEEKARALALEEFFDEELGAHVRLLAIHHLLPDSKLMVGAFMPDLRGPARLMARATIRGARPGVIKNFGISPETVELAFRKIREAGERMRQERGSGVYLVGDRFTLADLTLAALVAPAVAPEQFPYPQPQRRHPRTAPLREALDEAGIGDFTRQMYARHRGSSAEVVANGAGA
jgi:glutathione S-transferase